MLSRRFIAALWSPAGKGLTSWLLYVMSNCDLVTFPYGILCQVWYLIVLIPDLCHLSYFKRKMLKKEKNRTYIFEFIMQVKENLLLASTLPFSPDLLI